MSTTKPTTLGELQLFKVLQRANLLSYYENFISQGGDDVQQLCEAGEEEFLEIMALVGMACKPLHVRRLQKALQEWVTRPAIFRGTNIHYLPAQSVPLTSLGIDTRDLPVSSNSQTILTSPGTPNSGVLQIQDDDLLNRPLSVGGSAMTTPVKSLNGIESVFRMDGTSRRVNGTTNKVGSTTGSEIANESLESSALDHQIKKFVEISPTAFEKKEVIKQLKLDRGLRELAIAIEDGNQVLIENLTREHINHLRSSDNVTSSRHETLFVDAAVKLCLADERYILKKSELFSAAEKIAVEVKSKLPRRRSSTHLHGSCSQSRMQEVTNRLQNMKSQRADLHQRLAEAQNHKNVIKENECQNILARLAREEVLLLQEKSELEEKLKYESKDEGASTHREQSTGLSTDLADLAKAHNLSFGNIQSLPSSQWSSTDNNGDSFLNVLNNSTNADHSNPNLSPHRTTGLSPPQVVSIDFNKGTDGCRERSPEEINRIKVEDTLNEAPGFPSNSSSVFRNNKRKLSAASSNGAETITRKRILGSGTNSE